MTNDASERFVTELMEVLKEKLSLTIPAGRVERLVTAIISRAFNSVTGLYTITEMDTQKILDVAMLLDKEIKIREIADTFPIFGPTDIRLAKWQFRTGLGEVLTKLQAANKVPDQITDLMKQKKFLDEFVDDVIQGMETYFNE